MKWFRYIEGSEAYVGAYNVFGNLDYLDRWDLIYGNGRGIDFYYFGSDFDI